MSDPEKWCNRSPGDVSVELEEHSAGNVEAAVQRLPPDVREHDVSRAAYEKLRVLLGVSGRS